MDNIVVFPSQEAACTSKRSVCEGATLFMHQRKTTLIVHLVKPRGERTPATGVSEG